jgi:osmoprotectant transport system permease protein
VGIAFPVTLALGLHPLGYWATLVALVALALPPMFVNAYTGVRQIDAALVEAAQGMGMSERQVLGWVELPLALPVIMAGIRTAVVEVLATATIGAVVGFGGLGRYIIDGFAQRKFEEVFVGGVLVALLVIVAESSLRWAQRRADFANRKGSDRPAMSTSAEVADPVRVG